MSQEIPDVVWNAQFADGRFLRDVVDIDRLHVTQGVQIESFRQVWLTRRDIDIPIWLDLGTIDAAAGEKWHCHIADILAFIDRADQQSICFYSFVGQVFVLFCSKLDEAFVIDLPKSNL